MHVMRILNSKDTKEIREQILKQWGAELETNLAFLKSQKDRIYMVTRDVAVLPDKQVKIDNVGMYFAEQMSGNELRLGVEGAQIIGKTATKGIIEVSDEQMENWLKGMDVLIEDKMVRGYLILRHRNDVIGCGFVKEGKIQNYMPKNRRLRELNPTFEEE